MPKYLQKISGRLDFQLYHLLADDGIHAVGRQCGSIEAGFNGWQVVELESVALGDLCWHCFAMTQPKAVRLVKWRGE